MKSLVPRLLALAFLTTACAASTGGLVPVSYPDPNVACPGGRPGWKLEVVDRRARREGSEDVVALVGESIRRSFPGCRWDAAAPEDAGRVLVEIHRFATIQEGNTWEAAAEWTVVASDGSGRTLTEFETREEVSRPNYRGSNNARESLRLAFDSAIRRTLTGLRVLSVAVSLSPSGDDSSNREPAARRPGRS
jgi:hypothetical protein